MHSVGILVSPDMFMLVTLDVCHIVEDVGFFRLTSIVTTVLPQVKSRLLESSTLIVASALHTMFLYTLMPPPNQQACCKMPRRIRKSLPF
jgi:hypothetical protein